MPTAAYVRRPQSMNTVVEYSKILMLASNERITLVLSMLLLKFNHMQHCSPATVCRGGVIFVNAVDIGWRLVSWPACTLSTWRSSAVALHHHHLLNF